MTNSDNIKKKAMLDALTKSLGVVTIACKEVDISRQTHYRWLQEDDNYNSLVEGISDVALDYAESKLHKLISKEDTTAIIFYLKTKGKKRGYIERQEFTGKDGTELYNNVSDDELISKLDKLIKQKSKN